MNLRCFIVDNNLNYSFIVSYNQLVLWAIVPRLVQLRGEEEINFGFIVCMTWSESSATFCTDRLD